MRKKYLQCGVEGQATWPREKTVITFGSHELHLFPLTKDHSQSISIDISRISNVDGMTIINRFLSLISWCSNQGMHNNYGWSGNPIPVPVLRRKPSICTASPYPFYRPPLQDKKQRLAIALYREALTVNSPPYEILGYFKIINVVYKGSKEQIKWINDNLQYIDDELSKSRIKVLNKQVDDIGQYLYGSGRCAVAHAFADPLVDPDDLVHLRRLSEDVHIIKSLARHLIKHELGVSDCFWGDAG